MKEYDVSSTQQPRAGWRTLGYDTFLVMPTSRFSGNMLHESAAWKSFGNEIGRYCIFECRRPKSANERELQKLR